MGGDGGTSIQRPDFSDQTTLDLRLFADLGQRQELVRRRPWFRGVRVSLAADNVSNDRVKVRDESGLTPLSYEVDRLDPLGRTVRVSFRRMFSPPPAPSAQGAGPQGPAPC